jgi:hypothetical protein
LFVVFLQLTVSGPLHAIYDQSFIGEKIGIVQKQERTVAVFPHEMSDQFQFSGRLTQPLQPIQSYDNLVRWAVDHPQQYCLLFTKSPNYSMLVGNGLASKYRDGWLIFRPAKDFYANYLHWLTVSARKTTKPAIEIAHASGQLPALEIQ